jgi:manganese/zinc/iron transport system substrate-binding protein
MRRVRQPDGTLRGLVAALAMLVAVTAAGCGIAADGAEDDAIGSGPVKVTTTTNFITDSVARIGGDRVTVQPLMGTGVDPHLYRASEGDVAKLRDADLILYGGLELEGKMEDVLEEIGEEQPSIAVTDEIPTSELLPATDSEIGEYDPHVWFDVGIWMQAVERMRDALIEVDPAGQAVYERNTAAYLKRLERLDEDMRTRLASVPEEQRVLITSHDAFRYLGAAYDVEVAGIQGVSTQTEATTSDIERIAALIADRGIPSVFVESSIPPQTIDAVLAAARDRGADVEVGGELFSDAAGSRGTPEGTYVGMVEHNLDALVEGLR